MKTYYRLKIERDESPMDPREGGGQPSKMWCWHPRYTLGDKNPYKRQHVSDAIRALVEGVDPTASDVLDGLDEEPRHKEALRRFESLFVSLSLHLYDHSGITMSTGAFADRWDSGGVGFICVSKKEAKEQYGHDVFKSDGWTEEMTKKVIETLETEVEVYDQFLTGAVYGYQLEKLVYEFEQPVEEIDADNDDLPWEDVHSCWGFYGDEVETNGITDDVVGELPIQAVHDAQDNLGEWHLAVVEESK